MILKKIFKYLPVGTFCFDCSSAHSWHSFNHFEMVLQWSWRSWRSNLHLFGNVNKDMSVEQSQKSQIWTRQTQGQLATDLIVHSLCSVAVSKFMWCYTHTHTHANTFRVEITGNRSGPKNDCEWMTWLKISCTAVECNFIFFLYIFFF